MNFRRAGVEPATYGYLLLSSYSPPLCQLSYRRTFLLAIEISKTWLPEVESRIPIQLKPLTLGRRSKGCGSPVVKVSNHGRHVMSSIPVPLKTRRVGQRCTLNLSRAETSSRWCGVVVRRGGASSGVVHVT
ncbi:uncharacterized protein TNCV_1787691 [Trichonephila clavipes]|nr:uncharacterized protein TNCV_1787691 [Trichonephila clavipes]